MPTITKFADWDHKLSERRARTSYKSESQRTIKVKYVIILPGWTSVWAERNVGSVRPHSLNFIMNCNIINWNIMIPKFLVIYAKRIALVVCLCCPPGQDGCPTNFWLVLVVLSALPKVRAHTEDFGAKFLHAFTTIGNTAVGWPGNITVLVSVIN